MRIDEPEFRIRPAKPPKPKNGDGAAWSVAFKRVMHFARMSRRLTGGSKLAGGLTSRPGFHQRCAVRIMYSKNAGCGQWRAHGRYIVRGSAAGSNRAGFDQTTDQCDIAQRLDEWQTAGDPRLFKLIISPEFGERLDLRDLTRRLMSRMESDQGSALQWVAVAHFNTEHPHVHVALRGIRDTGEPLVLGRDYVKSGIRARAEELCTAALGYRTERDAAEAARREIPDARYTSLDRLIRRRAQPTESSDGFAVTANPMDPALKPAARVKEQHLAARLQVLQSMGLADSVSSGTWLVRSDFEGVLCAMQRAGDRQKMLAAHAALLSDPRLPMQVTDHHSIHLLEGRVITHGEEENSGRTYMLLEGTDARVHFIYHSSEIAAAWQRGRLRPNSFIRLRRLSGDQRLGVFDLGDADEILKSKEHFRHAAVRECRKGGIKSPEISSGWLGRYYGELNSAAVAVRARKHRVQASGKDGSAPDRGR
jgi:type IV secretory pathway VirD2 relaxase